MICVTCVQVILAPVVQPPSQTGLTTGFYETPLYAVLSEAFGYLNSVGYCATGNVCKNFPILLEIGSPLSSLNDRLMMESLADYMTLNGLGTAHGQSPLNHYVLHCTILLLNIMPRHRKQYCVAVQAAFLLASASTALSATQSAHAAVCCGVTLPAYVLGFSHA